MNFKMIGRFFVMILSIEAIFMLPALGISIAEGTHATTKGFALTLAVMAVLIALLAIYSRHAKKSFFAKEGLFCTGLCWILLSLVGALPFYLSGEIPSYIDALFEMVSGFTTTGASIVPNVEALSKAVLYWRSFSHWLGGMGVLVFVLAIIPVSGKNEGFTMHVLRAESPGPSVGKLVPKMRQTAAYLYLIYVVLTMINFLFLVAGDMPVFDAVCTALGTAGTGGFGIKADSMASYSPYLQNVTTVFMLIFGVNFSCYYLLLMRHFRSVFKDEELRLYLGIVIGGIILIALNLYGKFADTQSVANTVRHSAFQVSSIITTTGFASTDFDIWPAFSKAILLFLMMVGGCAGSTAGGLKCARFLLLIKSMRRNLRQVLRPNRVEVIRVNDEPVPEKLIAGTNAYFGIYIILMVVSFLLISLDNLSIATNLSAVMSCSNNVGPALDAAGPMYNYDVFSPLSKLVLTFDMLAGRLEIFPILVLFSASTWKKN
ncbi:MAG: TrkH family potassium uptake protein [Clostridia bacterium]|nr:TrkH family potassium uptake protein [Clostridia bacterium]